MINSVKIDLMKKVKAIFRAEGFSINPQGLATTIYDKGKLIASVWPDNTGNLNVSIENGLYEGTHGGLDIKRALLLVKDAVKEMEV